ncbi:hypothetical protein LCGC14_0196780 [marine sediment metagenome]|uniref:Uncharacterized protein n=1 Tax=marine sediment metagenome TaxID=412755 RepID=A0A0F9UPA4_9ZZZZ
MFHQGGNSVEMLDEISSVAALDEVLEILNEKIATNKRSKRITTVLNELKKEVQFIHPLIRADGTRKSP